MEISIAVNYILSHLYTKLPRRRVDNFGEELERYIHIKFQNHWFPNEPARDAPFRCLNVVGPQVDLIFPEAASVSGLDWNEIQACLPEGLVLTIDPGHVACQYHQPAYPSTEFNRFNSTTSWPSASLSLSSSGCSSASSSISSTNVTPNANQLTHQVIYCVQDSWLPCNNNNNQITEENQLEDKLLRELSSELDHDNHLATEAALSVLAENDDTVSSDNNIQDCCVSKDILKSKTFGNKIPLSKDACDPGLMTQPTDTGFSSLESSRIDIRNSIIDMKSPNEIYSLNRLDHDPEHPSIQLMAGSQSGCCTLGLNQNMHPGDRLQLLSLMNKTGNANLTSEGLALNSIDEAGGMFGSNNHDAILAHHQNSKFESLFHQTFQPKFNQNLGQPLRPFSTVNQFVQKSTSTPSFTAATFAQTKFGSTKLKNHSKRTPNRMLSPTNLPQTFNNVKLNSLVQRDSIVSAFLNANNQKTNFNPLGETICFDGAGKTTQPSDFNFAIDGRPHLIHSTVNNYATHPSVNTPLPSRFQIRSQASALDEFWTDSQSDAAMRPNGKCYQTGDTMEPLPSLWQTGLNQNPFGYTQCGCLNEHEWSQTEFAKTNNAKLENKRGSMLTNCLEKSNFNQGGDLLYDDGLLSTQMVNLLLEEDGGSGVLPHGASGINYNELYSIGGSSTDKNQTGGVTNFHETAIESSFGCDALNVQ